MFKLKSMTIIIILIIVILFNALDLIDDFATGASLWHIIEESVVITLSLSLIIYLFLNLKQQSRHLQQLQQELQVTEQSLAHSNSRILDARKQYSKVIQQQFEDWQLSQSEQEIALLLLKGLSFNEIASIRQTKEKTVRQQASDIYRKANVSGRHGFSAWFFEDFLT